MYKDGHCRETKKRCVKGAIVLDKEMTYMISATLEAKGAGRLIVGNLHPTLVWFGGEVPIRRRHLPWSSPSGVNYFFHPGDFKATLIRMLPLEFSPVEGSRNYWMMPFDGNSLSSYVWLLGGATGDELERVYEIPFSTIWIIWDLIRTNWFFWNNHGTYPWIADFEPHRRVLQSLLQNIGTIGNKKRC